MAKDIVPQRRHWVEHALESPKRDQYLKRFWFHALGHWKERGDRPGMQHKEFSISPCPLDVLWDAE